MVSPPPGGVLGRRASHRSRRRGPWPRPARAPARPAGVAEPLEGLEHPLPLLRRAPPARGRRRGPRSRRRSTWATTRTGLPAGVAHGVADQVGHDPLQQPGVGAHQRRGLVELEDDRARRVAGDRQRQHLLEAARPQHAGVSSPDWRRDRSSRLSMRRSSWSVERRALSSSSCRSAVVERSPPADQAVDGGPHRRQRRTQVVRDRAQQGGAGGVGALEGGRAVSRSRSRRYSRTSPVWTAKPSSTRWSSARSGAPHRARTWSSSTATRVSAVVGSRGGVRRRPRQRPSQPRRAPGEQRRPTAARRSRAAGATIASAVSCPVSTDCDSAASVAASARARARVGGAPRGPVDDGSDADRDGDEDEQRDEVGAARRR